MHDQAGLRPTARRRSRVRAAAPAILLVLLAAAAAAQGSRLAGELDAKALRERLARERGQVVLLNFWATWCEPCREEFPSLVRLQKAYAGRGLRVLGVSTDFDRQRPAVERFLAAEKPPFPNYRRKGDGDEQDFIEAVEPGWGGELPFSVLYARDGRKARVLPGKQSYESFENEVLRLLK